MKCFKCQLKCAGNPEGNLSHFPSAMTPREIMANQKWSKWSTWSRDHETIRTCAENAVDVFSCLVFAAPALKSSPPRAPICAIWAPWSFQVLFWSSFDIFWTSFGHSVCPSYVVLHHLTSSYVFLLQTMVLLTWCVLCRPSICRRSISLISHLFGFNLPSWGLPRWCGCKWVKTSKKWWINHKILRILEVPYRPHLCTWEIFPSVWSASDPAPTLHRFRRDRHGRHGHVVSRQTSRATTIFLGRFQTISNHMQVEKTGDSRNVQRMPL